MTTPILSDAYGHHVWATIRIIDACLALEPGQLETTVPGTYGSIIETSAIPSGPIAATCTR